MLTLKRQLDSTLNPNYSTRGSTTSTLLSHNAAVTHFVSPGLDDGWRLPRPAIQFHNPPRQDDVDFVICWGSSLTSNVDVIPVLPGDKSMASSPFDSLVQTVTAHGQAQSARAQLLLSCVNDLADNILRDEEDPSLIEYEPTFKPNVKLQTDWTNKNYVSSNIIPIPMTHTIRPTIPDEDDDMVQRAKYDDVKMYALVVGGILEQMKRDQSTNGVVHPMSEKSLLNILRTSQTKYEEIDCSLRTAQDGEQDGSSSDFSDGVWELFYIEEDNTTEG